MKAGTITRLSLQQKNAERVSVFLDDEFAFGLYKDTVIAHQLRKGTHLTAEQQAALLHADSYLIAKNSAFNIISRRMHSAQELRRKLVKKEFPESVIAEVIAYLSEKKYVDDKAFAKMFAESRFRSKKHGANRIRMDLLQRGVAKPIIDKVLGKIFANEETVYDTVRAQGEKQWNKLQREPDARKRSQKLYAFLIRRGFSGDVVMKVVREMGALED
jgi:regulatory protein